MESLRIYHPLFMFACCLCFVDKEVLFFNKFVAKTGPIHFQNLANLIWIWKSFKIRLMITKGHACICFSNHS